MGPMAAVTDSRETGITNPDASVRSCGPDMFSTIAGSKTGFWSLGGTWADTMTAHGQSMLPEFDGLTEFERELIPAYDEGRDRARSRSKQRHTAA